MKILGKIGLSPALALLLLFIGTGSVAFAEMTANKQDAYVQRLVDALADDESYKVRLQAAVLIGGQDQERLSESTFKLAVQGLIGASKADPHYTVRAAALLAIANTQAEWGIAHILKQYAADPDDYVRQQALRALTKYERAAAIPYVVALYGEPDVRIRREVVRYLAAGLEFGVENVLMRALGDVAQVADVAQEAIRSMPADKTTAFLKNALEHKEPSVRRNAVDLLGFMDNEEAAKLVLSVYERDIEADEVRQATRYALRNLKAFLPIAEIIENVASEDKHTRAKSLRLLGVIGEIKALKHLREALNDRDVYIRGTAVMALGELGEASVIKELKTLEEDPANQRILHLIRHTLKKLDAEN